MHRIDTPTAQVDKFGAGKNGFTRGNPQTGVPATALDDDYFDAVQEELAGIVEAAGITLKKTDRAQVLAALKKLFLQSGNNLSEIKDAGATAVAQTLLNLGLGDAAKRSVGTSVNQIPDMSYFASSPASPGYQKIPGGLVMQFGFATVPIAGSVIVNYPLAFTTSSAQLATPVDASSVNNYRIGVASSTTSTITLASTNTASLTGVMWLAIGRI